MPERVPVTGPHTRLGIFLAGFGERCTPNGDPRCDRRIPASGGGRAMAQSKSVNQAERPSGSNP